jgi:uridine kinase
LPFMTRAASQLAEALSTWLPSNAKLVVGIDGYSGVGKTTLVNDIAKHNAQVLPVHMDDFMVPVTDRERLIANAADPSEVYELYWNDYKLLRSLIDTFHNSEDQRYVVQLPNGSTKILDLSKRILLLEGIFVFHPKLLNDVWDRRVLLELDPKIADQRRITRETQKSGSEYIPESNPTSFFRLFKIAYLRYLKEYQPKMVADMVIKE